MAPTARKPGNPASADTKRARSQQPPNRHSSLLLHLQGSSTFCCQCGFSLTPNHASPVHPIGRIYCRMCEHSACASCYTSSPYITKLKKNYVQVPADKNRRPTFGFVCCEPGCGWSQLIAKDDVPARVSDSRYGKLSRMFKPTRRRSERLMLDFKQHSCIAEPRSPGSRCGHSCCDHCIKFQMNDGNQDVSLEAAAAAAAAENGEVDLVAQAFKALPADGKRDGVEKVHNLVEPNRNAPFRPCQHHGPGVPMHCRVPHDDDDGKKGPCSSRDEQKARDQHERQEQLPSATMVGRAQRLQASKNLSKPFPSKNFSKPFAADDLTVSSSESLGPPPAPALAPARKERHVNETPVLRAQLESCHGNPPASKPVTAQPEFINLGKFEIDPPTLEKNQTAMMGITIRGPKIAIPAPSSSSSSYSKPARSNAGAILHNRSASPLLDSGGIVGGGGGGGGGGGSSSGSCSRSGVSGSSSGQKSQGWSLFPSPVPVKSPEYSLEVPRKSRFTEHIQTYQRLQADKGLAGKHMDLHGKCELKRQGARKKGRALDASV